MSNPLEYARVVHRQPRPRPVWWRAAGNAISFLASLILAVIVIAVLSGVVTAVGGVFFGWIAGILVFVALPMIAAAAISVRRKRGAIVLAYIEQATRLSLPLDAMLVAARHSETGSLRYRIASLRELMLAGMPLGQAIEHSVPEISVRTARLIDSAERLGQLPATMHRLVNENRRQTTPPDVVAMSNAYPIVLPLMIVVVIGVVCVFVMPKFEQILRDFETPIPAITKLVLKLARTVVPLVGGIALMAALVAAAVTVRRILGWRSFGHANRLAEWCDRLFGRTIVGRFFRDRHLGDVCFTLADAFRSNRPADAAIGEAMSLSTGPTVHRMLKNWQANVQRGDDLATAAAKAKWPCAIVGMIGPAERTANLPDTFGYLARFYSTRFDRGLNFLQSAVLPMTTFVGGVCVLAVALCMFLPLIEVVNHLDFSMWSNR